MSVTRINGFQAQEGRETELKRLLEGILPGIRSAAGCRSRRLLQNRDDPSRLVVLEEWESVEAHRESVKAIPPESLERATELLAGPPQGGYYED